MSDSSIIQPAGSAPEEIVIGTAGHIDHGKTCLVRALTGTDTDRLPEEKQRGISIDLGFAHWTTASGQRISFVDVPGHERFVRNMLAGAAGMRAVLLVVAADEGVKPQTREHFDICRMLGLEGGVVAITKAELASDEQLRATRSALDDLRRDSFLADAPVIAVSAATGAGLEDLRAELTRIAVERRARVEAGGVTRLPIDRSFALKGFGTVVTGTLSSGPLRIGETMRLYPGARAVRIRGLQGSGQTIQQAQAGQRVAVNLAGVEHSEIRRGFVLTEPSSLGETKSLHASVTWLPETDAPGSHEDLLFHAGTAETTARVRPVGEFVRIDLAEPLLALPGDRFVLRRPSPAATIGGGVVIEAFAPKRLSKQKSAARLRQLAEGSFEDRLILYANERENGRRLDELVRFTGKSASFLEAAIRASQRLVWVEGAARVVTSDWLTKRRQALVAWLEAFHKRQPALPGAPVAQARLGLDTQLAAVVFTDFAGVRVQGDSVALARHVPQTNVREAAAMLRVEQQFRQAAYQPAHPQEMLKSSGTNGAEGRDLLERLIKNGRLVRVAPELVFHAEVIGHIRQSLAAHKGRRFSVPEFKEWTQVSRKYAIPLLEYLDRQRVTRRDGDNRVVL